MGAHRGRARVDALPPPPPLGNPSPPPNFLAILFFLWKSFSQRGGLFAIFSPYGGGLFCPYRGHFGLAPVQKSLRAPME